MDKIKGIPELKEKAIIMLRNKVRKDEYIQDVHVYAWPQIFSSTAGPKRGAIGGAAMTEFTVIAFVTDGNNAVCCCCNEWVFIDRHDFKPLMNVKFR